MLLAVLLPFVLLGVAVVFVASSGGPGKAREAYLTKGGRLFRVTVPILYLVLGVGVPAIVIASRGEAEGAKGRLRDISLSSRDEHGKRVFRVTVPILYLVLGVGVPAIVIASRGEAEGAKGRLRDVSLNSRDEHGKRLFRETCASCHSLDAVNARGVTGPDLDEIGQVTKSRVLNAIRIGGTGQKRMPAGLLQGQDADDVAGYVSKVAGR